MNWLQLARHAEVATRANTGAAQAISQCLPEWTSYWTPFPPSLTTHPGGPSAAQAFEIAGRASKPGAVDSTVMEKANSSTSMSADMSRKLPDLGYTCPASPNFRHAPKASAHSTERGHAWRNPALNAMQQTGRVFQS